MRGEEGGRALVSGMDMLPHLSLDGLSESDDQDPGAGARRLGRLSRAFRQSVSPFPVLPVRRCSRSFPLPAFRFAV
jgi:hypothetical protein